MPLTEKGPARKRAGGPGLAGLGEGSAFWILAALIALLAASQLAREIDRPFHGLHSVDQAHNAWLARSHVVYGLDYTLGLNTFAVGNPPADPPIRYLDHPSLYSLLDAASMSVLGVKRSTLRITNLVATVIAVLLLMALVRALSGGAVALMTGLIFVQLPLVTYFGINQWLYPMSLLAIWCYLTMIGSRGTFPQPGRRHVLGLGLLLFIIVQINWQGFFFALAIGTHYLARCWNRRQWPEGRQLALLAVPPLAGTALNFMVLAAAGGWDYRRLMELARWRAGSGEREVHEWGAWVSRLWEFSLTDFTLVVLILALGYLTIGKLGVHLLGQTSEVGTAARFTFPQFWLFSLPGIYQIFLLKGVVWEHQWWLRPLALPLSIAAALCVLQIFALLSPFDRRWAWGSTVVLLVTVFISTSAGTNYYYGLRGYYPERVEMFETLGGRIPPDKALLSFESYRFDQKPGVKQGSYRPEVAWHLDRDIVVARTLDEIEAQAQTGRFTYYLMPTEHGNQEVSRHLVGLARALESRYAFHEVRARPDQLLFVLGTPLAGGS